MAVAAGCRGHADSAPATTPIGEAATTTTVPVVEPEPVVLSAQHGSRGYNNEFAVVDRRMDVDYSLIDEEDFLATTYNVSVSDDLALPTEMVGYRNSQANLPSDETINALARAIGIQVHVQRHSDLPGDPDFEPPADFAYWEAFDSSTGQSLTVTRGGVYDYGLPVLFDFRGADLIVDAEYGEVGDTGEFCKLTEVPVPGMSRSDCPGDIADIVEEVTLPTVDEAEAIAAEIIAAADPTVGALRFDTTVTEAHPQPNVAVRVRPASPTSPQRWYFEFGADGNLHLAGGNVGTLDVVDQYPLIGLDKAIERLNDKNMRWLAPAGIEQQSEPHPPEPASHNINIVDIEADLWVGTSPEHFPTEEYGHSYWLPAYAFVDSDGTRHIVPAVTDQYLRPAPE
jgi:hypothetical protein